MTSNTNLQLIHSVKPDELVELKPTVAMKCKSQRQKRKHNGKSKNTTAKEKTQWHIKEHNGKRENTTILTKTEKVGTLERH